MHSWIFKTKTFLFVYEWLSLFAEVKKIFMQKKYAILLYSVPNTHTQSMQFRGFHIMVFTHPSLSILFSSNSRLPFASISHGCLFLIGFSVRMKTETPTSTSTVLLSEDFFFSSHMLFSEAHSNAMPVSRWISFFLYFSYLPWIHEARKKNV